MSENTILADLKFFPDQGSLRFNDVRYLLIRPETLASFQGALESEVGEQRAGELLYAGGYTGGRLSGIRYKESFGLTDREAILFMCDMGGQIGWGRFHLQALDSDAKEMVVTVDDSPFAEAYQGKASGGVCHLIRGVLGGLGSGIFGVEVQAREMRCLAQGDDQCHFEIQPQPERSS